MFDIPVTVTLDARGYLAWALLGIILFFFDHYICNTFKVQSYRPNPPGRRESISRPTSFSSVQCVSSAVIKNRRLNSVALLAPLRSGLRFTQVHTKRLKIYTLFEVESFTHNLHVNKFTLVLEINVK